MLQLKLGVNLESLKQPFRAVLRTAAELDVSAVEINARSELPIAEMSNTAIRHIRKLLADANLSVGSLTFPTRRGFGESQELDRRIEATKVAMKLAYELGAKWVVSRVGTPPEDKASSSYKLLLESLSELGRHGQRVCAMLAIRTGGEPGDRLRALIDDLPPACVGVDFDPGSLIINDYSATDAMQRLGSDVVNFRATDAVRDLSQGRGVSVQTGRGSADFPMLLSLLEERQYSGYIVVEALAVDPTASATQAIEYLRNMF